VFDIPLVGDWLSLYQGVLMGNRVRFLYERCNMAKAKKVESEKAEKVSTGVKRPRIDEEAFVATWREVSENKGSPQDVAAALGCSLGGVYVKAKSLIEDGVPLPSLSSGRRKKRDVSRLTEILKGK